MVFVEVKTRARATPYHPTLAMTEEKKKRVRLLGDYYCAQHLSQPLQPRFDVVAVTLQGAGRGAHVEHFINAF